MYICGPSALHGGEVALQFPRVIATVKAGAALRSELFGDEARMQHAYSSGTSTTRCQGQTVRTAVLVPAPGRYRAFKARPSQSKCSPHHALGPLFLYNQPARVSKNLSVSYL
jgi:hypothetical protein